MQQAGEGKSSAPHMQGVTGMRGGPFGVSLPQQAYLSNKAGSVSMKLCAWLLGREAW